MTKDEEIDKLWFLAKAKDAAGKWKSNIWPVIRTDRGDLERAWALVSKGKTEEDRASMVKAVGLALPEQAKGRQREKDIGFMPQPVGIGTYIRKKRWFDPITKDEDIEIRQLPDCQCGQPVMGPSFKHCQKCHPDTRQMNEELREVCRRHGIHKMTRSECLDFIKSRKIG